MINTHTERERERKKEREREREREERKEQSDWTGGEKKRWRKRMGRDKIKKLSKIKER
jgi:hypothetical protein